MLLFFETDDNYVFLLGCPSLEPGKRSRAG